MNRSVERDRSLWAAARATLLSRSLSTVGLVALTPVLTRLLGVQQYGILVTLTSTAAILGLGDLGIANGLVTRLAAGTWESDRTRALLSSATALLVSTSVVGGVAAFAASRLLPWPAWFRASPVPPDQLRLCVLLALTGAALTLTTSLGQKIDLARQRGKAVAVWSAGAAVASPAAAVLTALATPNLVLVVAATAFATPLTLAAQTCVCFRALPRPLRPRLQFVTRPDMVEAVSAGSVFLGLSLVIALAYQLDTLVVAGSLGAAAAAKFSVVMRLFGLVGGTVQGAMMQLWSAFAEALAVGDVAWVRRALRRWTMTGGGVALLASAALVSVGRPLIGWWLGPAFRPSVTLLLAAAVWTSYSAGQHAMTMFLNGADRARTQLLAALPMAVLNITLSLWLVNQVGAAGPLWASTLAHVTCIGLPLAFVVKRHLRMVSSGASVSSTGSASRDSVPA